MSFYELENFAISELASGIDDSVTSLSVKTGEGALFPATGNFMIVVAVGATASVGEYNQEIMKCTARTTDTLTVVRAQEGTAAAAHIAGELVALRVTKGVLNAIEAEINTKSDGVATDTIFTAAGDTVVGTGPDAAARLAIGTDNHYYKVATNTPAWEALDISDDTTPTLGGNLEVGAKSIHLDEALSSDHTYSGHTADGVAGEEIDAAQAFGKLLYQKFSDNKWYLADKDAEATAIGALAICVSTGAKAADSALLLALPNTYIRDDTWAFDEADQYVGDSGALADQTAMEAFTTGDQMRKVGSGYALTGPIYVLYFNPSPDWGEIA